MEVHQHRAARDKLNPAQGAPGPFTGPGAPPSEKYNVKQQGVLGENSRDSGPSGVGRSG